MPISSIRLRSSSLPSVRISHCESRLTISSSVRWNSRFVDMGPSRFVDIGLEEDVLAHDREPSGGTGGATILAAGGSRGRRLRRAPARRRRRACRRGPPRGTRRRASGRPRAAATARPRARARRARPRAGRAAARAPSPAGSGPRPNARRRGWPRGVGTSRASSRGASARTVPMPTATASDGGAQLVHEPAALLAGHPAPAGHGDPAVERDRDLVGDERPAARDPRPPRLVLRARLEAVVELGLDAGLAQPLEPAGRLGVRVARAGHDPRDAGRDRRLGARRRRAPVRARLHRHVERRAARPLAGRGERDDLAVPAAGLGHALADDLAVRDDDRADRRLRVRAARHGGRPARARVRGSCERFYHPVAATALRCLP